jgi:hypothetical protein
MAPQPVEKRGGRRMPVKRIKPVIEKVAKIYPKQFGQYRFLITTDFSLADINALLLLAHFIKKHEKYYDEHEVFPIYGFIIENNNSNLNYEELSRNYLKYLCDLLEWDYPNSKLYQRYLQSCERIWISSIENSEKNITNCVSDLKKIKSDNLFLIHMKNISHQLTNEYLTTINSIGTTNSNINVKVKVEQPEYLYLDIKHNQKVFDNIDSNSYFSELMYSMNDITLKRYINMLLESGYFNGVNMNDWEQIYTRSQEISVSTDKLTIIKHLMVNEGNYIPIDSQLVILGLVHIFGIYSINSTLLDNHWSCKNIIKLVSSLMIELLNR